MLDGCQDEDIRQMQGVSGISGQRIAEMRERLNFQRFKYELLCDMWAMRVLDNEALAHDME